MSSVRGGIVVADLVGGGACLPQKLSIAGRASSSIVGNTVAAMFALAVSMSCAGHMK